MTAACRIVDGGNSAGAQMTGTAMNSQWIRTAGSQFAERCRQTGAPSSIVGALEDLISQFGHSRAVDLWGRFQDPPWLALSAAQLNLPGARIAAAYGPEHGWAAHGDRRVIESLDRPLTAGEMHILD